MKIEIRWKKATDEGYPRRRVVEIETPVERGTTALEDAVLALPYPRLGGPRGEYIPLEPCIQAALEESPTDQDCVKAIEVALAGVRARIAELEVEAEKDRRERAASEIDHARKYVAGLGTEIGHSPYQTPSPGEIEELGEHDLAEQVAVEIKRRQVVEDEKKAAARIRREAADEKEAAAKEARRQEKIAWIGGYGSERLRVQIEAGLDGWPLYLHERLAVDLPGTAERNWELDNDGETGDPVLDPSHEAVRLLISTAQRLVELKLATGPKTAIKALTIRRIEFPDDQSEDEYYDERMPGGTYLVCDCYRPGLHKSWSTKSVRIAVDE